MKGPKEKLWFFSQGCMNGLIYNTAKSWFKTCRFLIQFMFSLCYWDYLLVQGALWKHECLLGCAVAPFSVVFTGPGICIL